MIEIAHSEVAGRLDEILRRVQEGEIFSIVKDGRTIAKINAADEPLLADNPKGLPPGFWDDVRAFRKRLPPQKQSITETIREMRDEGY